MMHRTIEMDDDAIISLKSNYWTKKDSGAIYERAVAGKGFFSEIIAPYFIKFMRPDWQVLDMGAGTGRLSMSIVDFVKSVTSIDISQSMIDILNNKKGEKAITTQIVDAQSGLPFADNTFDAVVSMDFLIHFPNWDTLLQDQCRVVKIGGYLINQIVNKDNLGQDVYEGIKFITKGAYYSSISHTELELFCEQHSLLIEEIIPYNIFFTGSFAPYMSPEELYILADLLGRARNDQAFLSHIKIIEKMFVSKLPPESTAFNIVCLKKI